MKVIGHRGAAGLALENTLASFELARLLGVDAIELDVQMTKDHRLVVVHDNDLKRISGQSVLVRTHTLSQVQKIQLRDGQSYIPSLEEVLSITKKIPLYIELKAEGCSRPLLKVLTQHPGLDVTIVSFKLNELSLLRELAPSLKLVSNERTRPIEIIQLAKMLKLDGIGLNFWLLNPLTYLLIKRANLSLFVYTVNNKFLGKLIRVLYPRVAICSDHPEWFLKHPYPVVKPIERAKKATR